MIKYLSTVAVLAGSLVLSGCENLPFIDGGLDTADKRALAFCSSFSSTLNSLTLMRSVGKLSAAQIEIVDTAVATVGPSCSQATPPEPTSTLIRSLDILIAIQLLKE